ncbi:MAG TPA: hypothetical protein VFQ45_06475 [Longimicrobium sp.]|nr:hypothetical protein [Longimicrobium sp.]
MSLNPEELLIESFPTLPDPVVGWPDAGLAGETAGESCPPTLCCPTQGCWDQ